jgi:hypothetical protein
MSKRLWGYAELFEKSPTIGNDSFAPTEKSFSEELSFFVVFPIVSQHLHPKFELWDNDGERIL